MSCEIRLAAQIVDIPAIRKCLFPTDDNRGSETWLQTCKISVCPSGDLIVLAHERRLVVLALEWHEQSSTPQYSIQFSGPIHDSDNVRAVLCLPVVNENKGSHAVSDWTCILLGFESGFIRFYSENVDLLLEEQLHNEIVGNIKCRSQHNPRPDICPDLHTEEIYIQYQSNICIVQGTQVFPLLRALRNEFTKFQGKSDVPELGQINLNLRKWGFTDQAVINDVSVVGVNLHSTFDHLLTASTCGGFETKYRNAAPYNSLVLAVGSRPFVGFHYALEGCPQPVLSDVAKAVASKLKSALPGWLTGSSKTQQEKQLTTAMQPSETMGCRFGLCDLRRTAQRIILSWDHKFAAVSDDLGRVILIDSYRGVALRIFKGYRDAQCCFIQVPDERHSKHRIGDKVALFLVIYSPKKGTLEIFTVQEGTKVAIFTASKFSRLLYINYGLMGYNTTLKSRYTCQFTSVFINNDGAIKEILIPFHFALKEKNSARSKDLHLFKKLKNTIKTGNLTNSDCLTDCLNVINEIKSIEIKKQILNLLLKSKVNVDFFLNALNCFIDSEIDNEQFKSCLINYNKLLIFFKFINSANGIDNNDNNIEKNTVHLDSKQIENLQKILDFASTLNKTNEIKVKFDDNNLILTVGQFLSLFDVENNNEIKPIDETILYQISKFIYEKYIIGQLNNFDDLKKNIIASEITSRNLFSLLINYWVNRPLINYAKLEDEMANLKKIINILVDIEKISWDEIRIILAQSSQPFPALIAAILCKIVAKEEEKEDDDEMEILTEENVEWSLLIGKLEDVSLLNIILANRPQANDSTLPKLNYDPVTISLTYILQKGRGAVSELVAQWLTTCGLNPENLVINDQLYKVVVDGNDSSDSEDDLPQQDIPTHKVEAVKNEPVFDLLNTMRVQFPYSLDASVLLANMCWEYGLSWQKDIRDLSHLNACTVCLKLITNSHIQEGLYKMVWNTHLKIIFENTCKLVNKVGKLPKEILCRQDTGLSDHHLNPFLTICTEFLDNYMRAVKESYKKSKPHLQFEQIWDNGPQALVELTIQQTPINYNILHLHYQLSLILQLVTSFPVKQSKILNKLFEPYIANLFFVDFQTKTQITWDHNDSMIQSNRVDFLHKILSASIETITVNDKGETFTARHVACMTKCLEIANLWNINVDILRRFQVVEMYRNGHDNIADEAFSLVENLEWLGQDLLSVAGKRMSNFLESSPNLGQNITALTPAVTRYMEGLDDKWCAPSSLNGIENLCIRAMSCLKDGSVRDYKVAEMLLDGCQSLQNLYKNC